MHTAGDVNNDGFDDFLVGMENMGVDSKGSALLFCGLAGQIASAPCWVATGEVPDGMFGMAVSTAGDVNGDGCDDVIIGSNANMASLYLGGTDGLSNTPGVILHGSSSDAWMGNDVRFAGDVNSDGYDDFMVNEWAHNSSEVGAAHVYHGGSTDAQRISIGGRVHIEQGGGVLSVMLKFFNQDGSLYGQTKTDIFGYYRMGVPKNWIGAVRPVKRTLGFIPASRSYDLIPRNQVHQDYVLGLMAPNLFTGVGTWSNPERWSQGAPPEAGDMADIAGVCTMNVTMPLLAKLSIHDGCELNMDVYEMPNITILENQGILRTRNRSRTPFPAGLTWGGIVEFNAEIVIQAGELKFGSESVLNSDQGSVTIQAMSTAALSRHQQNFTATERTHLYMTAGAERQGSQQPEISTSVVNKDPQRTNRNIDAPPGLRPSTLFMAESYPNPFNEQTHLCIDLGEEAICSCSIYNVSGKRITFLFQHVRLAAGIHRWPRILYNII